MKRGTLQYFRRRRIFRLILVLGGALLFLLPTLSRAEGGMQPIERGMGEPRGVPLAGQALSEKTHEIALLLRCTTCQGSSVADSPSSTALNMRQEVQDLLALGYSSDQILDYFESRYGQFVLLQPKAEGLNLLVWIGPGVLLLLGAGILVIYLRRGADEDDGEALATAAPDPSEDDELAPWIHKVRELADGGGSAEGEPS